MKFVDMLENKLAGRVAKLVERRVIIRFDEFCNRNTSRLALLSYMVWPLLPPPPYRDRIMFSNHGIAQEIPRALNELGFIVDIVSSENLSWSPSRPYDLFIGHAGINFERLSRRLPDSTCRIYFSTGLYWREWNARIARRIYDLACRRGYVLPPYRSITYDEEYANQIANGIICLGNRAAVQSYSQFPVVIGINNAIFPLNWDGRRNKDYNKGRKHFLFFSGRGNIHKGLDLVLEAFAQTDLHLHICQHMEPDFVRIYRYELERPNIHVHGFVKMRSPKFEVLARLCNWVISATCAEGQPGAILECMGYGLIPILPDSANIDLEDWGIRLPNCEVETIRSTATQVSETPIEECQQRAACVVKVTRDVYSVENFRKNFKEGVAKILATVAAKSRIHIEQTTNKG